MNPSATETDAPFWAGTPDAPAFERLHEAGLARARAAIERLGAGASGLMDLVATFDEAAYEIECVAAQASLIENVHPDPALRETAERMSQKASALATELSLNSAVYDALAALDASDADPDTRYYLTRTLRDFRLSGVDRDEPTRARIARLREELVTVGQEFSRNIRSDRRTVRVTDPAHLSGLPADFLARHAPEPDGGITISTDYPDALPVFTYADHEPLRRALYMEFNNRAHPANVPVLERMIALRHELATTLGYPTWAAYLSADKMVGSSERISEFIDRIAELSGERAARDYDVLLARKRRDTPGVDAVQAWESTYWAEQVRRSDYDFDAQSVRPYFPYARMQQGVLDVASRLYGVTFARVEAPVWHPSVECWECLEDGRRIGRFYLDMHPRPNKFSHAAEFDLRPGMAGRRIPEAALVCNFPGGDPSDPGLMEHADVKTLFHEFGHLLHALLGGRRRWSGVGGIRTEADFVEVPSQLFEEWTWDPEVLRGFAHHHETGEPIPADQVAQMKRAAEFGKGLYVRRQMALARISLGLFDRDPAEIDVDDLVRRVQTTYQPYPFVPGTHFQCSFGHLDGYSAGYYTYMWSLVIAKDFFGRFLAGRLMDGAVAGDYRRAVLDAGGSKPADEIVRDFLGRDFSFEAYRAWLEREE